jgi:hypothetical protein
MRLGVTALLGALLFLCYGAHARASVFCPADVAFMTPWNFSTDSPSKTDDAMHYFFSLTGDEPVTVSGHMIVVSDTKAYTVPFDNVQMVRSLSDPKDFESDAAFIALPQNDTIRYAWVDDITDSSGKHSDCPTFPYRLEALTAGERARLTPDQPHALSGPYAENALKAQFKMDLPPLNCPKPYDEVAPLDSISQTEGFYDPSVVRNPHLAGRVDVDSAGNPLNVEILQSSGAIALDAYVREWYGSHKYKPAKFRCIPVVSTYYFDVTYGKE